MTKFLILLLASIAALSLAGATHNDQSSEVQYRDYQSSSEDLRQQYEQNRDYRSSQEPYYNDQYQMRDDRMRDQKMQQILRQNETEPARNNIPRQEDMMPREERGTVPPPEDYAGPRYRNDSRYPSEIPPRDQDTEDRSEESNSSQTQSMGLQENNTQYEGFLIMRSVSENSTGQWQIFSFQMKQLSSAFAAIFGGSPESRPTG